MKHLLTAFALLVSAQVTYACSCMPLGKLTIKDYNEQTTIFIGKVKNVRLVKDPNRYEQNEILLEIVTAYKGVIGKKEVRVFTNTSTAACGLPVEKGQTWLLYANIFNNQLSTSACTRSSHIAYTSADDLRLLKTFAAGKGTSWKNGAVLQGEGKLVNQLPVGKWKYYYPNGLLAEEGSYINGKKDGRWLKYLDVDKFQRMLQSEKKLPKNGSLNKAEYRNRLHIVDNLKNGESHGSFIEYNPMTFKPLRVVNYLNGKEDGLAVYYYDSGLIERTEYYSKGELNGFARAYHENGQLMYEGKYTNGNAGTFKVYNDKGQLIGESAGPPSYESETKTIELIKN